MEDNAYETLVMSAYIMVFLTALTATIYLFTSINNYADLAFDYGKKVPESSISTSKADDPNIVNPSIVASTSKQIIISGAELITYYYNYKNLDFYGATKPTLDYVIRIGTTGDISNTLSYSNLISTINVNKNYTMVFEGYDASGKANIRIYEIS